MRANPRIVRLYFRMLQTANHPQHDRIMFRWFKWAYKHFGEPGYRTLQEIANDFWERRE
jgi:hypothetical protein